MKDFAYRAVLARMYIVENYGGGCGNVTCEIEKIEKAKIILEKIAKGVNPITGEQIEEESFLNDARIIRCFYFVTEVVENVKM